MLTRENILTKNIKSKERVREFAEVYTPTWLVKHMCDLLNQENGEDVFTDLDATWLEPSCGNGNFLVEILRRKLARAQTPLDRLRALGSIYGCDLLEDNIVEARARMLAIFREVDDSPQAVEIVFRNVVQGNFLTQLNSAGERIVVNRWRVEDGRLVPCDPETLAEPFKKRGRREKG